jgi:hypothetical protein
MTAEQETREGLIVSVRPPSRDCLHLAGHYEVIVAIPGEERLKTVTLHSLLKGDYTLRREEEDRQALRDRFETAHGGTVTIQKSLLVGNLYAALQMAERDDLGRAVIYTTADGARERGVLLHPDLTLKVLQSQPVLLRTPEHLERFVAEHIDQARVVLVSSDTGGRPERYQRGIDFVMILNTGDIRLSVPGAHQRNGGLLHDARWQALDLPLEGNRTVLEGSIPPSAWPAALDVLGQLKSWYVAHDYRDWYNRLAHPEAPPDVAREDADHRHTPEARQDRTLALEITPTRRPAWVPGG